jgi:hypothetical protein
VRLSFVFLSRFDRLVQQSPQRIACRRLLFGGDLFELSQFFFREPYRKRELVPSYGAAKPLLLYALRHLAQSLNVDPEDMAT